MRNMRKYTVSSDAWNVDFYKLSNTYILFELAKLFGLAILISVVFFGQIKACIFVLPLTLVIWKIDRENYRDKQKSKIKGEFKNLIVCLAGNLGAGYALENAFVMSLRDIKKQDEKCVLGQYEQLITNELACNVSLADILIRIAKKSDVDEIQGLSSMIVASKRYGGDIIHLIKQYSKNITDQNATQTEIDSLLAAKKLEGKVMILAPLAMILYMKLTNPSYMNILYTTLLGKIIMSACLIIMLVAIVMTEKIVRIEV